MALAALVAMNFGVRVIGSKLSLGSIAVGYGITAPGGDEAKKLSQ